MKVQIDRSNPLLVEFGEMVDLRCNATGCPEQPSFTWRPVDDKPFKLLKDENGFITIKNEALDNIELVCKAECKDTPSKEKKIKLVVYCKYRLRLKNKPQATQKLATIYFKTGKSA